MANTFNWLARRCCLVTGKDGLCGIFNTGDDVIEVVGVEILDPIWPSGQLTAYQMSLARTTAASGGIVLTAGRFDTNDAVMPTQVKVVAFPDSVTVSGTPIRSFMDMAEGGANIALNGFSLRSPLKLRSSTNSEGMSSIISPGDGTVQSIILREGEGVAIVGRNLSSFANALTAARIACIVNVGSASYAYTYDGVGPSCADGEPIFSIFNGVGSGVVLTLSSMEWAPVAWASETLGQLGGNNRTANLRLLRISAPIYKDSTVYDAPVAMDTSKTCPATLQLLSKPFIAQIPGVPEGMPFDWPSTPAVQISVAQQALAGGLRAVQRQSFIDPSNQGGLGANIGPAWNNRLYSARTGNGIILRKGQGLALCGGADANYIMDSTTYADVRWVFVVTPPLAISDIINSRAVVGNANV